MSCRWRSVDSASILDLLRSRHWPFNNRRPRPAMTATPAARQSTTKQISITTRCTPTVNTDTEINMNILLIIKKRNKRTEKHMWWAATLQAIDSLGCDEWEHGRNTPFSINNNNKASVKIVWVFLRFPPTATATPSVGARWNQFLGGWFNSGELATFVTRIPLN